MAKESKTILQLDKLHNVQGTDLFPIARPGTEGDNSLSIDDLIHFEETNGVKTITFLGIYKIDLSSIIVIFSRINVEVSEDSIGLGSVTGGGEFRVGDTATLVATPNTTSEPQAYFVKWADQTEQLRSSSERTVTVAENEETYTAIFAVRGQIRAELNSGDSDHGEITIRVNGQQQVGEVVYVEIGDEIEIEATSSDYEFNGWLDANNELITGATNVIEFIYGVNITQEIIQLKADFNDTPIVIIRTVNVSLETGNNGRGTPKIFFDNEEKTSVNIPNGSTFELRGYPNAPYKINNWKKGNDILGSNNIISVTIPNDALANDWTQLKASYVIDSSTYKPEFYYGSVDTPERGSHAINYDDLISDLDLGYLSVDSSPEFTLQPQHTYIFLYDASKVRPAQYKVITQGFAPSIDDDFDDTDKFYTSSKEINGITYTSIELLNGNRSDSISQTVEITFTSNNESLE